jgi:hypothetical protein
VEIDLPSIATAFQPPVNRRQRSEAQARKRQDLVIDVAATCSCMREITVWPGLARRRGVPPVRDAERGRQLAQHRNLGRREIVHGGFGVGRPALRRLAHEVVDKPAHIRLPVRCRLQSKQLHVDVGEQLAQFPVGNACRLRSDCRAVPDPDLLDSAVGLVPRVAFGAVETVERRASRVETPEHAVEGAVFEHQNDDVLNPAQSGTLAPATIRASLDRATQKSACRVQIA